MDLFGFSITRTKAAPPLRPIRSGGGWYPIIREPFTGAWQQNQEIVATDVVSYGPVFACVTQITQDIGKLGVRLMKQAEAGIWTETSNPAFSPVLRKPNRYQTRIKFIEQWMSSKLIWGNTYVLKERDARGIVVALYVLDPTRVRALVAPDGAVYYGLDPNPLAALAGEPVTVPASEIIHDTMICLYHPLCGVSPIYACGMAAMQGRSIQDNSKQFFANGSAPGGIITAPGALDDEQVLRLKTQWQTDFTGPNAGKVALLTEGLKFEARAINAVDADLIKQLDWTGIDVCICYHVPPPLVGLTALPPGATYAPLQQLYYSECLQSLIANLEASLDEGLGLLTPINGTQYGTECDINDLIWMDQAMRASVAGEAVGKGTLSPNEARAAYFGLGPVAGGETPYMQEQNWPLQLLADRELPTRAPTPPAPLPPAPPAPEPPPPASKALEAVALEAALGRAFDEVWAA